MSWLEKSVIVADLRASCHAHAPDQAAAQVAKGPDAVNNTQGAKLSIGDIPNPRLAKSQVQISVPTLANMPID